MEESLQEAFDNREPLTDPEHEQLFQELWGEFNRLVNMFYPNGDEDCSPTDTSDRLEDQSD